MNFFKLYIGDYQRDTAHLSITEHGAYVLMLQHYYATEKPLPTGKALHRMLRAQDKAERDAIDSVAEQFWKSTDDGLVNERADVEISKACAQGETNARIAREREARRKVQREQHEQSTNRATNDQPNQTPDTRLKPKDKTSSSTAQPLPRDESPPAAALDPITYRSIELVALLRRGASLQASNPIVREWAERGITDAQALTALEVAEQRRADQANPQAINAGFLNAILGDVIAPKARASPPARNTREARISNYAAEAAQARGEHENEHGTGRTERDITGESVRIA